MNFLKSISVIITLIFIASCSNRKQYIINEIHSLKDSIGLYKLKLSMINHGRDSIVNAYSVKYPATHFIGDSKERQQWILKEREAYREMILAQGKYDMDNIDKKNHLEAKIETFFYRIDSLKIELYE